MTSDIYTNTTPPDSSTTNTTNESSSPGNNPEYNNYQNDYQAAGEAPPSFTNEQIIQAALDVKRFLEGNKYLPEYITINGIQVNQATFLQLLTTTTIKINNSNTTLTELFYVKLPGTGTETVTPGTLTQTEYLQLAQNIQEYINTNQQAPATMSTVFGNIKFQSLLYLYTRALSMCQTYGTLPTYLAVRPWSNIPITDTNKKTITTQDITQTAIEVKNFLEYHKYLPDYITINGIVVNQATFLQLLTQTTIKINNQDTTPLTLQNIKQPTTSTETTTPGTLTQNEYIQLAENIQTFITNNGQAPATITSSLGNMKFESALYLYCRVLNNYKDNGVLPQLVTVRPWSASNIPIRDEFFTIQQITKTAIEVKNFLEGNKYLPEYITVNGVVMNQSQFIYLLVTATSHANAGDSSLITLLNANKPVSGTETIISANLLHDEYINIADTVKAYIEANKKAPSLTSTSLGQMGYQSLLYMYCRILNQYNLNQELPISINVKPWKTTNIPIYDKTSFTISEISQTAVEVKLFVDAKGYIPEWITVGGVLLNQSQFLHLLTTSVISINSQYMGSVKPVNAELPSIIVNDDLSEGTLSTDSYVLLAQQIKTYIEQNKKGPNSMTTALGTTSFKSLIYMYSRILQQYKLHQTLPTTIILKNWTTPIYDDHFTPQEITKTATDVKVFFDGNGYLPEYITISGVVVNQAQFLQLLVTTTLKLNSADSSSTYLQKVALPTSSYEKMSSGNINLADYIPLAQSIYEHITGNQVAAGSFDMILGKISFPSQLYLFSNVLDSFRKNQHLPESIYVKTWKTARTIGTTNYGNVVVLGAYGNLVSSVKIAYIVGVHPIESASHQALIEAIEAYDNSLAYCYYIYKVSVTKDASNYEKGRMNGQLLANMFAVPEIKAKKYNMAIDIHSNVGNWAQNRFVFSPISGGSSESLAWTIKNRIEWLSYFFPPSQTSPQYVTIPLIQGGIPAIIYETYTYESYDVTRSHANDFVSVVDGLAF
ncbi:hypothetical protein [Methanobacterium formicicum]|uniref:Uncharacterized protein n=1 Tax=Methanobacterium formicicum TaxID=2162 RepID=A0A0S4FNJ6_METFO|nr:hypothetical protein [Methanobacterium formicicum]CEL24640.1 hypothetical protein MB9_1001 [Methanobacterium formicicum]